MAARQVHTLKVVGSNPAPATIHLTGIEVMPKVGDTEKLSKILKLEPRYIAMATRKAMGLQGVDASNHTAYTSAKWALNKTNLIKKVALEEGYYKLYHQKLEDEVMAHRYLYYVECAPVISDYQYDELDRLATDRLPETSPVHQVGSELISSYSDRVIKLAMGLKEKLS